MTRHLDGMPRRVWQDPESREVLEAAPVRMPAFRGQITEEELRALGVYIAWLRAPVPGSGKSLRHRATEGKLR